MAAENFLAQATVYLAAAVVFVPIAKKLGMGSVLGYLLAGILIGPFLMGFVGQEGKDIMHFAEFGVVMMLFLIGLELEPASFWRMRQRVLGLGSIQMGLTALILCGAALAFGFVWQSAIALGLALSMSSTAIVLQTLKEKGLMQTSAGKSSFSVLLFQDIAVIPILAILPLLAFLPTDKDSNSLLAELPGWLQTLVIAAVAVVAVAGKFLIVPLLRLVARTRLREIFTASALLIVIAIAFLMQTVGLSPALGTFLAGVILANSEYRHELESDLEPFKGLLLGLFFIAVGASINFHLIFENPTQIFALVLVIMLVKGIVLFIAGKVFRISLDQNLLFALSLSQIGEFAFVLLAFTQKLQILDQAQTDKMMAVTALSMTITPLLLLFNERVLDPRLGTKESKESEPDEIEEKNAVIIAGFGHFGSTIGRFLRANGVEATYIDNDSDQVELLRKMGFKVYYGDATRYDLLKSAGADEAKILVAAINSPDINLSLVETVQKYFPNLQIMARTQNRYDAYELLEMGVDNVYRATLDTSVRLGVDVLKNLGHRSFTALRQGQNFLKYDEFALRKLAKHHKDQAQYVSRAKEEIELQELLLSSELKNTPNLNDHAWDSEQLRENAEKIAKS
jgi:monovalent cation:H+ antiporter-2, CPA2 family